MLFYSCAISTGLSTSVHWMYVCRNETHLPLDTLFCQCCSFLWDYKHCGKILRCRVIRFVSAVWRLSLSSDVTVDKDAFLEVGFQGFTH